MALYVCTNAGGVECPRVPTGFPKKPRCLGVRNPPFEFTQQDDAWSDVLTRKKWLSDFSEWVRSFASQK